MRFTHNLIWWCLFVCIFVCLCVSQLVNLSVCLLGSFVFLIFKIFVVPHMALEKSIHNALWLVWLSPHVMQCLCKVTWCTVQLSANRGRQNGQPSRQKYNSCVDKYLDDSTKINMQSPSISYSWFNTKCTVFHTFKIENEAWWFARVLRPSTIGLPIGHFFAAR